MSVRPATALRLAGSSVTTRHGFPPSFLLVHPPSSDRLPGKSDRCAYRLRESWVRCFSDDEARADQEQRPRSGFVGRGFRQGIPLRGDLFPGAGGRFDLRRQRPLRCVRVDGVGDRLIRRRPAGRSAWPHQTPRRPAGPLAQPGEFSARVDRVSSARGTISHPQRLKRAATLAILTEINLPADTQGTPRAGDARRRSTGMRGRHERGL